ncbi:hypothetical protein [Mucilaginibacter lappiensis]|uniref:Uncharacterized protein n=1 Tax=Mucilaginibacter lappiensis TaxID=354630 RepID=A0A841JMP3_9SPHI|nr:hypothetical protein [Mucilaginibacter lappiensis]MBB6130008.1 hypothetical protein [Mucilaginibacter lappiensis]
MANNIGVPIRYSLLTFLAFIVSCWGLAAQVKPSKKKKIILIPFEASRFDTSKRKAEFLVYKGLKVMKALPMADREEMPVTLKGVNFTNGTIEFDAKPIENDYVNDLIINFHQKDIYNYESVYLRTRLNETEQRGDAMQYTPYIHGNNIWDLMTPYRGDAVIHNQDWNHFKLVISGMQMLVYINHSVKPTMKVSRLEGNYTTGAISFNGEALFANLIIKPDETEGLSPAEGLDITDNDPRYIRNWQVTYPQYLEKGHELTEDDLPKDTTQWQPIVAERRGIINLSRRFEGEEFTSYPKRNRYTWLKTTIKADIKRSIKIDFGFNKEVYVFINRKLVYNGKNGAGKLYEKNPGGRVDVSNYILEVPLKQGDNELLIGIANQIEGWGMVARLENLDGVTIQNGTDKNP